MARFRYRARTRDQKNVEDTLEALGRKEALRQLQARGWQVLSLTEEAASSGKKSAKSNEAKTSTPAPVVKPPTRAQRLPFLQALSDLSASGLSAGESVRLLATRIQEPGLRSLSTDLWAALSEGATLSQAMAKHPSVFDDATLNLIQAGEATGNLREVLGRLIFHLREEEELRRQLVSALAYPIFVTVMAGGVILFFLFFLMPRLQGLFTSLGGKLPLSTQILVNTSEFALHYGLFVLGGLALLALSLWRWVHTPAGRERFDGLLLRLPLLGPFLISRSALTFAQTLSVLLENGITTTEALRMTERQLGNTVHRKAFADAVVRVLEGESISRALERTDIFPPLLLDQLAIGENTGNLVPSLKVIGTTYQKKLSQELQVFIRVLSSTVLMAVFLFVGFIAFAIVSAVFDLSSSFKF